VVEGRSRVARCGSLASGPTTPAHLSQEAATQHENDPSATTSEMKARSTPRTDSETHWIRATPALPDHHHGPHMPQSIWEYWAAHASSAAI